MSCNISVFRSRFYALLNYRRFCWKAMVSSFNVGESSNLELCGNTVNLQSKYFMSLLVKLCIKNSKDAPWPAMFKIRP